MTNRFWLGITDVETQGKWVNSHGRDVEALMMWDSGQPSNQINESWSFAFVSSGKFVFHDSVPGKATYACSVPQPFSHLTN